MDKYRVLHLIPYVVLAIILGQIAGCAGYEHGYTTSRYAGQWLQLSESGTSTLPGDVRLQIERNYDPALDTLVASKGLPDYIHVVNTESLELVYLSEDKVYLLKRAGLSVNSKLVKTYAATEVINAGYIKGAATQVKPRKKRAKPVVAKVPAPRTQAPVAALPEPVKKQSDAQFLQMQRQNKWAVIVGISEYQHAGKNGLTNLIFANDDAKAFATSLRNLGWDLSRIKLLVNRQATEKNIRIALESWLTKAGPDDQIILFWAGHGYPDPENPEKVYLATYDTDLAIPATGYRMDRVRSALEEIGAKNVLLLADTCHAGKLITRGERGISIIPQIARMKREKRVPKGWVFMVGADTDRQAIEHTSWTNGAFTHILLKGLRGEADGFQSAGAKDTVVTMGELKAYVSAQMPDETQKVLGVAKRPVITTSTGDPDIWNMTLQVK